MDIDDFLDRELSDIGIAAGNAETTSGEAPKIREDLEASPLIENIKAQLLKGNIDLAEQSYVQLWSSLFEQKLKWNKGLYDQLYSLSMQFQSVINQSFDSTKRKAEHITDLISRGRAALKEGKRDIPFKIYGEIEELGNSIPDAFFEQKRVVQEQSIEYYRELRNSTDNELISRVAALIQNINHLIEKINFSISRNDIVNAILNYNRCIEWYGQIPEGFLRHKNSAAIRIMQIYKSLSIYYEMTNLQKEFKDNLRTIIVQRPVASAAFPNDVRDKPIEKSATLELDTKAKASLLQEKKEGAKKNIEKGFYSAASKEIEEALKIEPNDAESKAINAKIKTLI